MKNDKELQSGLYIVALPIGNSRDITLRAIETLSNVDEIYCEDTRVTMKILNIYKIKNKLKTYHDHNGEKVRPRIIEKSMGATEVHIVGGFHPKLSLDYYESMMKIIKKNHPELKIKAFTAAEIFFFSKLTKNSVKEVLSRLKEAGLDSLPGGGAELFDPDIRPKIARGKCSGQEWLDTMEEAHNLGIKSNATMLYGHIEEPKHVVDHLIKIRELQKKTNGFITLIPLKFSLENTELEKKNQLTQECSSIYDLKVVALSRLMLAGVLNNISIYWVADGKKLAQVALGHGGNDLVGTAFSEEVYRCR